MVKPVKEYFKGKKKVFLLRLNYKIKSEPVRSSKK